MKILKYTRIAVSGEHTLYYMYRVRIGYQFQKVSGIFTESTAIRDIFSLFTKL